MSSKCLTVSPTVIAFASERFENGVLDSGARDPAAVGLLEVPDDVDFELEVAVVEGRLDDHPREFTPGEALQFVPQGIELCRRVCSDCVVIPRILVVCFATIRTITAIWQLRVLRLSLPLAAVMQRRCRFAGRRRRSVNHNSSWIVMKVSM